MGRVVLVMVLASGLIVAGCSSSSGTDAAESTTTAPTSSSTTTTVEPTTVTSTTIAAATPTTPPPPDSFQVLVFHKTAGFRHDSIPAGIAAITMLGLEHGYFVVATDDASAFTDSDLADHDVIVFLSTTQDILDAGQKQALESFIQAGNGFVGIHSATDTEYDWPWYGSLVGAYFADHPAPQSATIDVVEPTHPTMQGLPPTFVRFDEWYDFKSVPGPEVTILATLDESSYVGGNMGDPHPIVWAHEYDGGRAFYTAFGHTVETFSEPIALTQLNNAILWAARSK